jgi:hypothetical protein
VAAHVLNADLRMALAVGWLLERVAELQRRTVVQVAADLFDYLETFDREQQARDRLKG